MNMKESITLIGMPASGKSTVGRCLAERLHMPFVDTDRLLTEKYGALPDLIDALGADGFISLESQLLSTLKFSAPCVIATGGSAVYGEAGMTNLRQFSTVVHIRTRLADITARIGDLVHRGVVALSARTVAELALERAPYFARWADYEVSGDGTAEEVAKRIEKLRIMKERK